MVVRLVKFGLGLEDIPGVGRAELLGLVLSLLLLLCRDVSTSCVPGKPDCEFMVGSAISESVRKG